MVSEFTIPNKDVAFSAVPQSEVFEATLKVVSRSIGGTGVVSGCSVDVVSGLTVSVSAGVTLHSGIQRTVSAGNVTADAAHATLYRIDLLVVDSSGSKAIRKGTAAALSAVKEPAQSSGDVVLAQLYIPPTLTTFVLANHVVGRQVFVRTDGAILIPCPAYPATRAGIRQATVDLPSTGGHIVIAENTPILSDGTTLVLNKSYVTYDWPKSSPFKAPVGALPYTLIQVGGDGTQTTSSDVAQAITPGSRNIYPVSMTGQAPSGGDGRVIGPAFAENNWVIYGHDIATLDKIREVSGDHLIMTRPVSIASAADGVSGVAALNASTSVCEGIVINGLHMDNNGNTNPGLKSGWTSLAHTTSTTAITKHSSTSVTVNSITGFVEGGYIFITDGSTVSYGSAIGWIVGIPTGGISGNTITIGPYFPANWAIGADVYAIAGSQVLNSVGITYQYLAYSTFNNVTGRFINGSMIAGNAGCENQFIDVVPDKCGHPYAAPAGPAIQLYGELGSYFSNFYSRDSNAWGWWGGGIMQCRGTIGATSSKARNVKLANSCDNQLDIYAVNGDITGVTVSNLSCRNDLRIYSAGHGGNGLWLPGDVVDGGNTDNYIELYAWNNNQSTTDFGDAYIGPLDVRNTVKVLNKRSSPVIVDQAGAIGIKYALSTSGTAINTTTETSIMGSGVGTKTVPPNYLTDAMVIKVHVAGIWSTNLTPTLQLKVKFGGTTAFDTGAVAQLNTGGAYQPFEFDAVCGYRTSGAQLEVKGVLTLYNGLSARTVMPLQVNIDGALSIDPTATNAFDVTAQWGTAHSQNQIISTQATFEVVNPQYIE